MTKAIFLLPRFHEYVTSLPPRDSSDNKERRGEKERIYRSPATPACSILSTRLSTEIRVICNFTSKRISREMVPPRWRLAPGIDSFFPLSPRARIPSSLKFLFCSYPRYVMYLCSSPHCAPRLMKIVIRRGINERYAEMRGLMYAMDERNLYMNKDTSMFQTVLAEIIKSGILLPRAGIKIASVKNGNYIEYTFYEYIRSDINIGRIFRNFYFACYFFSPPFSYSRIVPTKLFANYKMSDNFSYK